MNRDNVEETLKQDVDEVNALDIVRIIAFSRFFDEFSEELNAK